MKTPLRTMLLGLCGLALIGMGLYFLFLRPALLPEDLRVIGTDLDGLNTAAPGLTIWLRRVFWVMGGYIVSTGLLTLYVAIWGRGKFAAGIATLVGLTSIGWMTAINFIIDSDFKWLLLGFALLWTAAAWRWWVEVLSRAEDRA